MSYDPSGNQGVPPQTQYQQPPPQQPAQPQYQQPMQPQYQQPGQPLPPQAPKKPKGKLIGGIIGGVVAIVVIAILLLLLLGPGANTPFATSMTAPDEMNVDFNGQLKGEDAKMTRAQIDDYCGNGDAQVSNEEVACYEQMAPYIFEEIIEIDGEDGDSTHMTVDLVGATGSVTSSSPITVKFSGKLSWPGLDTNKLSYSIYMNLMPFAGEDYTFTAPPGYEILEASGLTNPVYNTEKTTVSGKITDGDINIMIVQTGAGITPESEPNNDFVSANSVSDGDIITGHLNDDTDSSDYFSISLQNGDTIEITLSGPGDSDFELELYDFNEFQVDGSWQGGSEEYISYSVTSTGMYYILVDTFWGNGSYTLSVEVS
ncbi:MAG: PPC domain-containing protein [Methanobacteriota archaeon]|nr:MAG: PPC domain-containing protein [Euryarchaeota archaeon]